MRAWHVFGGFHYYPRGGLGDYQGSYTTRAMALAAAWAYLEPDRKSGYADRWVTLGHTQPDGSLAEETIDFAKEGFPA